MFSPKTLCLFAGYDANNIVQDYVAYYISRLAEFSDVYYMADCAMPSSELDKLKPFAKEALALRHGKYDFGSWQELMNHIGWDKIRQYDRLILCNDSCYGPLVPFDHVFETMEKRNCDFWGLTENLTPERHLQSYFLVFNKKCIQDDRFRAYFDRIEKKSDFMTLVLQYETPLTTYLENCGFTYFSYVKSTQKINVCLFPLEIADKCRLPLIKIKPLKIKMLDDEGKNGELESFFKRFPAYDSSLAYNHLKSFGEWQNSKEAKKMIKMEEEIRHLCPPPDSLNPKLLIHLHIFYHGQIPYLLQKLKNLSRYDRTIVATFNERDEFSEKNLLGFDPGIIIKEVPNNGYDVAPFLSVLDGVDLDQYDYIVKLHTKGYREQVAPADFQIFNLHIGEYEWRNGLIESLLDSPETFDRCIEKMRNNEKIGMIGAGQFILPWRRDHECTLLESVYDEAKALGIPCVPYSYVAGTMFLARAKVFKPLQNLNMDFEKSVATGGPEYVKAHIYERMFGLLVAAQHYELHGIARFKEIAPVVHGPLKDPIPGKTQAELFADARREYEDTIYRLKRRRRKYKRYVHLLIAGLILAVLANAIVYWCCRGH